MFFSCLCSSQADVFTSECDKIGSLTVYSLNSENQTETYYGVFRSVLCNLILWTENVCTEVSTFSQQVNGVHIFTRFRATFVLIHPVVCVRPGAHSLSVCILRSYMTTRLLCCLVNKIRVYEPDHKHKSLNLVLTFILHNILTFSELYLHCYFYLCIYLFTGGLSLEATPIILLVLIWGLTALQMKMTWTNKNNKQLIKSTN